MRPLSNNLLLRRDAAPEVTRGSIIIPERAREKPQRGVVVAVGPGRRTDRGVTVPCELAPGDIAYWGKGIGVEVTVRGETLVMLSEDVVIAAEKVPDGPTWSDQARVLIGDPDAIEPAVIDEEHCPCCPDDDPAPTGKATLLTRLHGHTCEIQFADKTAMDDYLLQSRAAVVIAKNTPSAVIDQARVLVGDPDAVEPHCSSECTGGRCCASERDS